MAIVVPESRIFTQLLELEKRIDATLRRKKLDMQVGRSPVVPIYPHVTRLSTAW